MPSTPAAPRALAVVLASVLGAFGLAACATTSPPAPSRPANTATPDPASLVGDWSVALDYDPDQPPSSTRFVVTSAKEGRLQGTFYGTPLESGRVIVRGSELIFAGVTSDASGAYYHSGRLREGELVGQTLSTGRGFVMPWRARRGRP